MHAFQCNRGIITFLCFAFDCHLKVFGLNDLICSNDGGVVNSIFTIELLV